MASTAGRDLLDYRMADARAWRDAGARDRAAGTWLRKVGAFCALRPRLVSPLGIDAATTLTGPSIEEKSLSRSWDGTPDWWRTPGEFFNRLGEKATRSSGDWSSIFRFSMGFGRKRGNPGHNTITDTIPGPVTRATRGSGLPNTFGASSPARIHGWSFVTGSAGGSACISSRPSSVSTS